MKLFIFAENSSIFIWDPFFYATVQKFRLLDYVILLHATILSMALKGLVSVSQ